MNKGRKTIMRIKIDFEDKNNFEIECPNGDIYEITTNNKGEISLS